MKWMLMTVAVLVASIGAWYALVGSRFISEADVRAQYQNEANWLDEGKHAEICAAFDDAYTGRVASSTLGARVLEQTDKKSSCAALATGLTTTRTALRADGHTLRATMPEMKAHGGLACS